METTEATSTQNQQEQHNENVTSTEPSVTHNVAAGEDIIKYAETHELEGVTPQEGAPVPPSKPDKKKDDKPKNQRLITGTDRGTGKEVQVEMSKITSISRYIYVHNIFDPTPVIEHIQYKAITPNTSHVIMDITEETFEELRQLPAYKGKVHYNYVDNMAKNDPTKNGFYHRTFSVNYPEWIKAEDVQKQAQGIVSHYGIPDLSGIEKLLWPNFDGKIQRQSLASDEIAETVEEQQEVQEA